MDDNGSKFNLPRFFIENKHIAWVFLIGILVWGVCGYIGMPTRKDPKFDLGVAVAITPWPGVSAEKIEQLVTKKVEQAIAQNTSIEKICSVSRQSVSIVYVYLYENTKNQDKEFDDIALKLQAVSGLPKGAGPIRFIKDFGDTATLMLTVASPKTGGAELSLLAREIEERITALRASARVKTDRASIIVGLPKTAKSSIPERVVGLFSQYMAAKNFGSDIRYYKGAGFLLLDGSIPHSDQEINEFINRFFFEKLRRSDLHPDVWAPIIVRAPQDAYQTLEKNAGDKYTYKQLDDYTDSIEKHLLLVPEVARIARYGVLDETVFLEYSQDKVAAYGINVGKIPEIINSRNIAVSGGVMEADGREVGLTPSGEFKSERDIGGVVVSSSSGGSPVYLRDIVDIRRDYQNPPRYLNYFTYRDKNGAWQTSRAVTLSIQMREQSKVYDFGKSVNAALVKLKTQLPDDLILAKTSDQPTQVKDKIDLFMRSLYEAIILLILVALVGFWEWRTALLMATSIPLALAMTFGIMYALGVDLQQVSISSLILALGLLIDVPVVSSDGIKREMAGGMPLKKAAWFAPSKLAKVILFATLTNIVAYLPFLMLSGKMGQFLWTMPVVITTALIAAYIIALTLIPFQAAYILKDDRRPPEDYREKRHKGFYGFYSKIAAYAIAHRWRVLCCAILALGLTGFFVKGIKINFFPKDLSHLSYVDIWLPQDASFSKTCEKVQQAKTIILDTALEYGKNAKKPHKVIKDLTLFCGGGGPRFWFSVAPQMQQLNYGQIIVQVNDSEDTEPLTNSLQYALSSQLAGAIADVRQLETGKDVGIPVSVRISGENMDTLRKLAEEMKTIFRKSKNAARVRDDWGLNAFQVNLDISPDKANLSGISNIEVAASAASGISGIPVSVLREKDKQIPVTIRLRMEERANLSSIKNLYVFSMRGDTRVPLEQASKINYAMVPENIMRRNQFRTVTVECFPAPGKLPSEVTKQINADIAAFREKLPSGYRLDIGGEAESRAKSFGELFVIMFVSVMCIYLALVFQFKNAVKPLIVFTSVPFGAAGSLIGLAVMGAPFGFMAFLGIASLTGIIISHVIVLFDFIEEMHARGEPLELALVDAGIVRIRPVLITVFATAIALVPLALHGGPLWQPLCYAQIGGLLIATVVTLLLVPVFYAIFVKDLKIISWHAIEEKK
ncbi:MAG: efflux RND transporter permease subunit [Elusimicrobiaceae bacterium]